MSEEISLSSSIKLKGFDLKYMNSSASSLFSLLSMLVNKDLNLVNFKMFGMAISFSSSIT